jgi:hypothetical protein
MFGPLSRGRARGLILLEGRRRCWRRVFVQKMRCAVGWSIRRGAAECELGFRRAFHGSLRVTRLRQRGRHSAHSGRRRSPGHHRFQGWPQASLRGGVRRAQWVEHIRCDLRHCWRAALLLRGVKEVESAVLAVALGKVKRPERAVDVRVRRLGAHGRRIAIIARGWARQGQGDLRPLGEH